MRIISCAQMSPRLASCRADVMDNVRRMEPLVSEAASVGTQLLVFPELAFTGYSLFGQEEAMAVAEPFDGPTFKAMGRVAGQLQSYVAWGYVELDGESLFNSCSLIGPDGSLLSSYRKVNLYSCDYTWAKPGLEPAPVAQTELGAMSVIVCRDIRNKVPDNIPRTAKERPLMKSKVDIVAGVVNWGAGGGYPPVTFMDFVADVQCTLAVADRHGVEKRLDGFSSNFGTGKTAIITPDWKVHMGGMVHGGDCLVTHGLEG